jgi:predicted ATPase
MKRGWTTVEPIDAAYDAFTLLLPEIEGYMSSVQTEADVRLKVINRILIEVLHWPYEAISAEPHTDSGFADYALLESSLCRVIVEAKRDGLSLGCEDRRPGGSYKISGGVFNLAAARDGINQAIRYCGEKSSELACVTNGREWILFRGSRLGDGRNTRDGHAFVFPSLASVREQFSLFYNILSRESASRFSYRAYFQEAEGQPIRTTVFQKSIRAVGSAQHLPSSDLSNDIDRIMAAYFQRLTGDDDPGMLEQCFVETTESLHADRQIARIADAIADRIQALETGHGTALAELVERVSQAGRHEFVLIVGTKGAGKTTFITRFFQTVLDKRVLATSVVLRVDLREFSSGDDKVTDWIDARLIAEAEAQLFADGQPSFREIQGMFFDEYTRLSKGAWAPIYNASDDHLAFHTKFGEMVEDMRLNRRHDYLRGILRQAVTNRKYLPILVFDNADHFDIAFQQQVYQYARSIYEVEICLVILPVTDRTSWQLSKHGALQSFEHESFFLPAPRMDEIIRKRIDFVDSRVELERVEPNGRYSISGNLHLTIKDLSVFTRALQRVFLQTSEISEWISDLANHDVRRALALARQFIGSPHLRVDDLVSTYLSGSAVQVAGPRAIRALVRQKYDIYPVGVNDFVQNIYGLNIELATTPLLGVRILQLLADVTPDERRNALIDVDQIEAYFGAMSIENRAVRLWLDALLKTGLILDYDATTSSIDASRQVEIAPSGRRHLRWALHDFQYVHAMADVTPLLVEPVYAELQSDQRNKKEWHRTTGKFLRYLLDEDRSYCTSPKHEAYLSQERVVMSLSATYNSWADWPEHDRSGGREQRGRSVRGRGH